MTTTRNPLIPNQETPQPKSSWRPILITLLSALLLGAGSCFGFVTTLNFSGGHSAANTAFMVFFLLCVVIFLGGLVWAFVTWIHNAKREG